MEFKNAYEDDKFAEAYSKLEFRNTYYLAYRDLPEISFEHITGKMVMDFGCGAGRSTRFLRKLGFTVTGVDISDEMIKKARLLDPDGDYRLVQQADLNVFDADTFDAVFSIFTFDNIPDMDNKVRTFSEMKRVLQPGGKVVSLVSSPEIYWYEWASFSTKDFPENKQAKRGDIVKIINTDIDDSRPVNDVIWPHGDYLEVYRRSGLEVEAIYKPLGKKDEPHEWVNETEIAPWVIYVLRKS